jgi:hypothetical protein
MTIDDELILELIKPKRNGQVEENALIVKIIGTSEINYQLEESTLDWKLCPISLPFQTEVFKITPDIIIDIKQKFEKTAIEVENDIQWDFQKSLQQVKKYKQKFEDTRVIIPKDYERFAPLYKKEGFRVYLWKAKRRWQCLKCGMETVKEGPVTPKCSDSNPKCSNNNPNGFRLIGLKDTEIEEFT